MSGTVIQYVHNFFLFFCWDMTSTISFQRRGSLPFGVGKATSFCVRAKIQESSIRRVQVWCWRKLFESIKPEFESHSLAALTSFIRQGALHSNYAFFAPASSHGNELFNLIVCFVDNFPICVLIWPTCKFISFCPCAIRSGRLRTRSLPISSTYCCTNNDAASNLSDC